MHLRPGARAGRGGFNRRVTLESLADKEIIGWLIYRPDTDEFLHSHEAGVGYSTERYVKNPCDAYLFKSEQLAFRYSTFINREMGVVPLLDNGNDSVVVAFDCQPLQM